MRKGGSGSSPDRNQGRRQYDQRSASFPVYGWSPQCGTMRRMDPSSNRVTHFARTNGRNDRRIFGIKQADRLSHMYIIGKTGAGKSTLLERLILSDIQAGEGLTLVDPHGD